METRVLRIVLTLLTLMAALPMTARAADVFTAESYPAAIDGDELGTHVFSYGGREVRCGSVKLSGSLPKGSNELTLTPTYSECQAEVLGSTLDATVTTSGCTYRLLAEPTGVALSCEAGKDMVVRVYGGLGIPHTEGNELCVYTVKGQDLASEVSNLSGPPKELLLTLNSTVSATRVKGGPLTCGEAEGSASYEGLTTVSATSGGKEVGLDRGAAEPTPLQLTSAMYPVTISAEQTAGNTHVFSYAGREITCNTVVLDAIGTKNESSSAIKLTPTYGNCHGMILGNSLPATVTHNECVYNYTFGANLSGNQMHLECPSGKAMEVHIFSDANHSTSVCTYLIGPQTVTGIAYSNMTSDVTIASNSGIATTRTGGTLATCGGAAGTGTYVTQGTTMTGAFSFSGEPVQIDVG